MSISVPQAWVHQFTPMLLQTMQQKTALVKSQLGSRSMRSGVSAAIDTWERIGNVLLQPIGRHTQTVQLNPNHTRRGATMQSIGGGILLSPNVDIIRMLIQPQSDYRDMLAAAAVQSIDKALLDGSIGDATTITVAAGTGQLSYGTQAMLAGHQIGANTAMSLARIIATNVLMSKASVPTGPKARVFFYGPGQETDILAITQASSSDFTKNRIHDAGSIDGQDWEGFHWVQIPDVVDETTATLVNMLPLPAADKRSCIAMYREGVGFSSAQDPKTDIATRADLNNEIQVYISLTQGVVRLWEGAVVQVDALEN
jgi:hypothetical protein